MIQSNNLRLLKDVTNEIIVYWKYFRSFDWLRAKGEIVISAW